MDPMPSGEWAGRAFCCGAPRRPSFFRGDSSKATTRDTLTSNASEGPHAVRALSRTATWGRPYSEFERRTPCQAANDSPATATDPSRPAGASTVRIRKTTLRIECGRVRGRPLTSASGEVDVPIHDVKHRAEDRSSTLEHYENIWPLSSRPCRFGDDGGGCLGHRGILPRSAASFAILGRSAIIASK
jgi:hypothetical protein